MVKPPAASADTNITAELADFLHGGLIMYLATRSADLTPASVIASGLRVEGARLVTLFLSEAMVPTVSANLQDNGEMAVTLVKVTDHRSIQLKGRRMGETPATESDRLFQQAYMEKLRPELMLVGVPRSVTARLAWWPSRAIRMEVRDLFLQTPGADAGRRLEAGAGSLLRTRR